MAKIAFNAFELFKSQKPKKFRKSNLTNHKSILHTLNNCQQVT